MKNPLLSTLKPIIVSRGKDINIFRMLPLQRTGIEYATEEGRVEEYVQTTNYMYQELFKEVGSKKQREALKSLRESSGVQPPQNITQALEKEFLVAFVGACYRDRIGCGRALECRDWGSPHEPKLFLIDGTSRFLLGATSIDDLLNLREFETTLKAADTMRDVVGKGPEYMVTDGMVKIRGIEEDAVQAAYSHFLREFVDGSFRCYDETHLEPVFGLIHTVTETKAKFSKADKQKLQVAYHRLAERGDLRRIKELLGFTEIKPHFSNDDLLGICCQYVTNGQAYNVERILNIAGKKKLAQSIGKRIPTAAVQLGYMAMFTENYINGINYVEWLTGVAPNLPAMALKQSQQRTLTEIQRLKASIPSSGDIARGVERGIAEHKATKETWKMFEALVNKGY